MTSLPPIYYRQKSPDKNATENTFLGVSHEMTGQWQIWFIKDGATFTPQAFEAEFGFLPPCPPSATAKTRKEWFAHRKQEKGFKPKNNPSRGRRGRDDC